MPNPDGTLTFLEFLEAVEDVLDRLVKEGPTIALTKQSYALRSYLAGLIIVTRRRHGDQGVRTYVQ
jgi:hypothetical protein